MTAIITREDILAELRTMKPGARGRQAIERLAVKLTCRELEAEQELEAALMAGLAADPEWNATAGLA